MFADSFDDAPEVDRWQQFLDFTLPIIGIMFAAFCIWLAVRIVNRKERWAKRTALWMFLLLAYPLSFGPACYMAERSILSDDQFETAYRPFIWIAARGPDLLWHIIYDYASACGGGSKLHMSVMRSISRR